MARTVIREGQVLDQDFASEQEMEERFTQHNTNKLHPPVAQPGTDDNLYLKFDGTNYIWSEAVPGDGENGLPPLIDNEGKFLTNDGTNAFWSDSSKLLVPDPTGHPDTVLTTDGTDIFWQINSGGGTEGGIPVEPYYHDMGRDRYLAFDTVIIDFYMDGSNRKNMFMYQVPGIPSNSVPYKIDGEYCLIGWDFFATSLESGNIVNIVDSNSNVVLPITLNETTSSYSNTTEDILVTDKLISSYINNNGIDTPVIKLYMKKTYYPEGV